MLSAFSSPARFARCKEAQPSQDLLTHFDSALQGIFFGFASIVRGCSKNEHNLPALLYGNSFRIHIASSGAIALQQRGAFRTGDVGGTPARRSRLGIIADRCNAD